MLKLMAPWKARRGVPRVEPFSYPFLDYYGRVRSDQELRDELSALRRRLETRRMNNQFRELVRRGAYATAMQQGSEIEPRRKSAETAPRT